MVNFDEEIDVEDLADDIEPGCNFGYVIAKEVRKTNEQVDDLHGELYQNGYVKDIKRLRRYVEDKQEEHENRVDFRQKTKIAAFSVIGGGIATPIVVWLLGFL